MKPMIRCEVTESGLHSFYLVTAEGSFFLFHQAFRRGVHSYFGRGVFLQDALDFGRAHRNTVVLKTMSKLPAYIRYTEKEYGIVVLEQTARKQRKQEKRHARPATLTRVPDLSFEQAEETAVIRDDMTA